MFIQTEDTPNPATLKFLPGRAVLETGTANFNDAGEAKISPLASRLFAIEGVEGVFLADDFISVTRSEQKDWTIMKPSVLGAIMDHFTAGDPVMSEAQADGNAEASGDSEIVKQIKHLLETRVRPAVAQDGGDIIFHRFEDGIVYLSMQGACHGCPSSSATLKMGIENMLKHYVPEVKEVRPQA